MSSIILENDTFALTIDDECTVRSLINKSNGKECVNCDLLLPLISITREEVVYDKSNSNCVNRRMTFAASKLRRMGNFLFVGFETITTEIIIEVEIYAEFINFKIVKLIEGKNKSLKHKIINSVSKIRILQIPVAKEFNLNKEFGNCFISEDTTISAMSTSSNTIVNSESVGDIKFLYANCCSLINVCNSSVALAVLNSEDLSELASKISCNFSVPIL